MFRLQVQQPVRGRNRFGLPIGLGEDRGVASQGHASSWWVTMSGVER